MAGLSTKAIKTRIKSMASTRQITKAMELVASSKLRSAQSRAVACRPYFTALYEAMNEIADSSRSFESPYLRQAGPGKTIYIVIAGDRGLAGGYNNNVLKLAFRQMPQDAVVLPIGKKTVEFFQHRSCEILTEEYREAASVSIGDCYTIAKLVADGFLDKTYQNVVLVYTNFVSLLAQTPAALPLLPLTISAEKQTNAQRAMIYEGGSEAVRVHCLGAGGAAHGNGRRQQKRRRDHRKPQSPVQPGPPGRDHAGDHRDRCRQRKLTTPGREASHPI